MLVLCFSFPTGCAGPHCGDDMFPLLLIAHRRPVMLVGGAGCSKTDCADQRQAQSGITRTQNAQCGTGFPKCKLNVWD